VDMIDVVPAVDHWKASGLDLTPILHDPGVPGPRRCVTSQDHGLDQALDRELISLCAPALDSGEPIRARLPIRNVHRTVGTMLGAEVTRHHGGDGLPEGTIDLTFVGSAGQSFGAFLPRGVTLRLEGDSNDYVGKGLSGGCLVLRPDHSAPFAAEANIIAGNVIGYGATSGEIFIRGVVGERFAVRNSGATLVVEGVGDHACEYMTGGRVVIIGPTGRNLAAGMSGGVAYVLDLDVERVNPEMVDLEPLSSDDVEIVRGLLSRHLEETGSSVARSILDEDDFGRFTLVMPRDYRRAIEAQRRAILEGRDPAEAVMEATRG